MAAWKPWLVAQTMTMPTVYLQGLLQSICRRLLWYRKRCRNWKKAVTVQECFPLHAVLWQWGLDLQDLSRPGDCRDRGLIHDVMAIRGLWWLGHDIQKRNLAPSYMYMTCTLGDSKGVSQCLPVAPQGVIRVVGKMWLWTVWNVHGLCWIRMCVCWSI